MSPGQPSLPQETTASTTLADQLPARSEDGFLDLGSILPNLDCNSSDQAAADEKEWQFLADDLMQDNGDDLLASSGQAAASVPSAAIAGHLINLG
jgi:hypothetical protein